MNAFIKVAGHKFSQQQLPAEQTSPNGSEVNGLYLWESSTVLKAQLLKSPKIDVIGLLGFSKPPKIPNL